METPLIEEHRGSGATMADFSGCVLPARFEGFEVEYRAAREAAGVFDTNWNAVIAFAGPDRVRYLNAMLTNNVAGLKAGSGCLALLLNPQGHILAELEVYAEAERLLTRSHASVRERTAATLDRYIIMDDVQLEDLTDEVGSVAVEGPRAEEIARDVCGVALGEMEELGIREGRVGGIDCWIMRRAHFGGAGFEVIAERGGLARVWSELRGGVQARKGRAIGMEALDALRLEAGVSWFPVDFDDSVIPHEARLEGTHVSFTKGCYTGQEIVERVRSRGQVHRRRVRLQFSADARAMPRAGTKLRVAADGGAEVGGVTSAAYSPEAGCAIGMGYVRGEKNVAGSELAYDDGTATVVE
jgi:folate-binding protein YgfZ